MEKKYAFMLALLITLIIFINISLLQDRKGYREKTEIKRIIDGDTFELEDGRKIRLANINAPEKNTLNYRASINFLQQYLNKTLEIEIIETDKYGRVLVKAYTPENEYLNLKLIEQGLASKFLVKKDELRIFSKAEAKAIEEEKGIWKKSPYANCLETRIFEKEEKIIITNNCHKIKMLNFSLKDESRREYIFKDIEFDRPITLHSEDGEDNKTDIFWNEKTTIWNNDRDTLYIFDDKGNLVHYQAYGY